MDSTRFGDALAAAWQRRAVLHDSTTITAYRIIDGAGDGARGLYVDRYGPAAVIAVYDDAGVGDAAVTAFAQTTLDVLGPAGLRSVYVKPFVRDRSRLGGQPPEETRRAVPRAGDPQPDASIVHEHDARFEVRLHDGFSTGLFLDHREHRRALASLRPRRALNLFAYTCAFAVPLAAAGTRVTNVDVSKRYLDWGRRNLELNDVPEGHARFVRMDALEYLAYAARRPDERFDLVILDPPTFSAGDPRRGRRPWKASAGYPDLVRGAARVLAPGGAIFAATNAREMATPGALADVVGQALGGAPSWHALPPWPVDVREAGRVAAVLFSPA